MCIGHLLPPQSARTHPIAEYRQQLSISRCTTEFGYGLLGVATDFNDKSLICADCRDLYLQEGGTPESLTLIPRHYILIGQAEQTRQCYYCLTDLYLSQPTNECGSCIEAFSSFLAFLRREDREFSTLNDPTIIDIDPTVGGHPVIFSRSLSTFLYSLYNQRGNNYLIPVEYLSDPLGTSTPS